MEKQRTSTLDLGKDYEIDFITNGEFTLPDTETDTETEKIGCTDLQGGVHTAQK